MRQKHGSKSYQYPKEVLRPMFPNYAFVKLSQTQRSELFKSNAVIRVLAETETLQDRLLDDIRLVRKIETIAMSEELVFNADIKEGDRFLIESGAWEGVYGWLKKKRNRTVWTVEIECLNALIQATIDPTQYKMTRIQ